MYIQWEANEIISDELIRNLTLTFATIAIVSTIFIIDLRVSHKTALCTMRWWYDNAKLVKLDWQSSLDGSQVKINCNASGYKQASL